MVGFDVLVHVIDPRLPRQKENKAGIGIKVIICPIIFRIRLMFHLPIFGKSSWCKYVLRCYFVPFLCVCGIGFELKAYTLSHSTSLFGDFFFFFPRQSL
jgi:hypothetical protein